MPETEDILEKWDAICKEHNYTTRNARTLYKRLDTQKQ